MQVKIFSIPIVGGEAAEEQMNRFLRSKKILKTESQLVVQHEQAYWSFCIRYIDSLAGRQDGQKTDYKKELDEAGFQRFRALRDIRKRVAEMESVPPYVVFTDRELAQLAKLELINSETMRTIEGIGAKKVEKYGAHFQSPEPDEKG